VLQQRGVHITRDANGGFGWAITVGNRTYSPFPTLEVAALHALDLLLDLGVTTLLDELDEEALLHEEGEPEATSAAGPRHPQRWNNLAEGDLVEVTDLVGPYVVWGRPFGPRIVVIQHLSQP
jgi:hypothetical protein